MMSAHTGTTWSGKRQRTKTRRAQSLETILEDHSNDFIPCPDLTDEDHLGFVNQVRRRFGRGAYRRSSLLDYLARLHAEEMATNIRVYHSVSCVEELMLRLSSSNVAENVHRGDSVGTMHRETLMGSTDTVNRANLLSPWFNEYGSGTAKGSDGKIYMCELFKRS